MALLVIDASTWTIAGLGFAIVLVVLFIFIYVMKGLGWIMQSHKKSQPNTFPAKKANPIVKGNNDMVAVAVALNLYFNALHDEEPTHITLTPHHTQWNEKMYEMNNLESLYTHIQR